MTDKSKHLYPGWSDLHRGRIYTLEPHFIKPHLYKELMIHIRIE